MKQSSIIAFLTLLLFVNISAQREGPPEKKDMVKELKTALGLNDEQTKKIETIFNENRKKMDSMFDKKPGGQPQSRKEMDAMRESMDMEIEKILTEEQKKLFKQFKEKQKKEADVRMPPPGERFGMRNFPHLPVQPQVRPCLHRYPGDFELGVIDCHAPDFFDMDFDDDYYLSEQPGELPGFEETGWLKFIMDLTEEQSGRIASIILDREIKTDSVICAYESKIINELNENQKIIYRDLIIKRDY